MAAEKPFVNQLARWILGQNSLEGLNVDGQPSALAHTLVLLPNRRACRSLREAFLAETGGRPILLPRILPIGDLSDELIFHYQEAQLAVPAAISALKRVLLLTRTVRRHQQMQSSKVHGYTLEQAAQLAWQLADFIDEAAREGLSFDRLSELVPEDVAVHWQQTLDFLTIISRHWPAILEEEGMIDPVDHRNRLLHATTEVWKKQPPAYRVIAAGSTGSQPATALLLSAIARLPQGAVVLPGLDTDMPNNEWDLLTETHPQYALKRLLSTMECKRSDVKPLAIDEPEYATARVKCLRAVLQPPDATAGWAKAQLPLQDGLNGIQLMTADSQLDEARMIAIVLREALEIPGKKTALVTPDRTLARMVAAQMQRFGVEIDDSAGTSLNTTPVGCFLRLIVEMVASRAAPAPLLAVLRHPLAAAGVTTSECRRFSRLLETKILRGIRLESGLDSLVSAASEFKPLAAFLAMLAQQVRPLADCFTLKSVPLKILLSHHLALAQWLAQTPDQSGEQRLWAGDDGNQLSAFMADLLSNTDILDEVDPQSYSGLLDVLMSRETFRPRVNLHPRLHILSPMEARLQHFDLVILGGLNEGTWPSGIQADPWMSRPMRGTFGLPAQERAIGQSAHDAYLLCAGADVILTRASKVEGTPTVPSRWLVRLETLVKGLDAERFKAMNRDDWQRAGRVYLDTPIPIPPYGRPQPCPPLDARPRKLRVTAIDTWLRDPYMIYAQHILRLTMLEPLDREPDSADFGTLVHLALEQFTKHYPSSLPADAVKSLLDCGIEAFANRMNRPAVACLWWPRFEAMAGWLIEQETQRRGRLKQVLSELEGQWDFLVDGKPFTLTTRIDRLEQGVDGVVIVDYKTGVVPTQTEIDNGLANQLFLESLIAEHGQLTPAIAAGSNIRGLEYWKLSGNADDCDVKSLATGGREGARQRLETLIREYDNPAKPYAAQADPFLMPRYNNYAHLTRKEEWEN